MTGSRLRHTALGAGLCVALALVALALPSPSQASIFTLEAHLDGAQEVPSTVRGGFGSASIILDDVANTITWGISFANLLGHTIGADFAPLLSLG